MMEWRDEALVLAAKPHGETAAILEVFSALHGRHAGLVRGGASRRMTPHLQPGGQVAVVWRARLGANMGAMTVEPLRSRAGLYGDRMALTALSSSCALLQLVLPEREPHPQLWQATVAMLDLLGAQADWPSHLLQWELGVLSQIGYGLDLASCAVTGAVADLAFVSPKTGRAVSRSGAGDWADRLLPLPAGMASGDRLGAEALVQGFAITGHFLERALGEIGQGHGLPEARKRLGELFRRAAANP